MLEYQLISLIYSYPKACFYASAIELFKSLTIL